MTEFRSGWREFGTVMQKKIRFSFAETMAVVNYK